MYPRTENAMRNNILKIFSGNKKFGGGIFKDIMK